MPHDQHIFMTNATRSQARQCRMEPRFFCDATAGTTLDGGDWMGAKVKATAAMGLYNL